MAYIHQKPPKITQNDFLGPKGHEKVTYDLPGDPILVNFESWSSGIKKQIIVVAYLSGPTSSTIKMVNGIYTNMPTRK